MNRNLYILPKTLLCIGFLSLFTQCKDAGAQKEYQEVPSEEEQKLSREELIEKGKYLANTMGCHDCHSPKKMGEHGPEIIPELLLSGFQANDQLPEISSDALEKGWMLMNQDLTGAAGPWGISYAANLTSHETGIGTWSYEQFKTALTRGKFKGLENGRNLLPPMPWQNFKEMKEEEVKALFEFLQNTRPVNNVVPPPVPPDRIASLDKD